MTCTFEIASEHARANSYITVLQSPDNLRGKGLAVKHGMLAATGEWRFICDADLSMRIDELDSFLPPAATGFDHHHCQQRSARRDTNR